MPAILECEDDTSKTVLGQPNDFASDESKLEEAIMKRGSSRNASVLPWWSTCLSMKPDPYGYRFSKSWLLRIYIGLFCLHKKTVMLMGSVVLTYY